MNRFTAPLFLLIFIFALGSCTIEKRTFNRGYHVSWNKSFHKGTVVEPDTQLVAEEIKTITESTEEAELPATVPVEEPVAPVSVSDHELTPDPMVSEEQILSESPTANPDTVYYYPKFEPFGIASFAAAGISVLTFFTGVGAVIGFFLAVAGVILGAISLSRYKRSPELYRTNGFGIAGFVLSLLIVLFTIVAIAVIIAIVL